MATARNYSNQSQASELHSGDRMTREEFHHVYDTMPEDFKAELIGGIVYVSSPLKRSHAEQHVNFGAIFNAYRVATPGVAAYDNGTVLLSKDDEVQPDLLLRIIPECGGQSKDTPDDYVAGAPELAAEIAHSSRAIDLHDKKDRYARAGVLEYMVVCLQPKQLFWFDLGTGKPLPVDSEGILRSVVFPGLWIQRDAVLELDFQRALDVLNRGLAMPEHTAFVAKLSAARKK